MQLRTVQATRYITPLREGGSLPALMDADDGRKYVLKFRGSGHGARALIAELLGGEAARCLGLPVPELVFAQLDPAFGQAEGDEEIQDLLAASQGLNLALAFLPGAAAFDPALFQPDPLLASRIVWLDAFLTNVDRSARNTNLLLWQRELWLIDHGAALYFHHTWDSLEAQARSPFAPIRDHVLLPYASRIPEADAECRQRLGGGVLQALADLIPGSWLQWDDTDLDPETLRAGYARFLSLRLQHADAFTQHLLHARTARI
ncbi:MAG: HipA family kinase [Bacteroidia bacterium]|nr:HipA family kinase [Bacteroidia bacterium]